MENFLQGLFTNIGKKIKGLAKLIFVVPAIAMIIGGLLLIGTSQEGGIILGLLIMFIGPIITWITSWFLYAFGELVDKVSAIESNTCGSLTKPKSKTQATSKAQTASTSDRLAQLWTLHEQGMISDAEYQQAVEKIQQG